MKIFLLQIFTLFLLNFSIPISQATEFFKEEQNFLKRTAATSQNFCYELMAKTFWNPLISGFKPGRVISMNELDIQPSDKVLFVGEGTGLDFELLPEGFNKGNLLAFDYSSEMIKQAKIKACQFNIPEENIFIGDAQYLIFKEEKFDKIYFPLSLASIPNPTLALQEAERVLAPKGRVVIMEKLIDDGQQPSYLRQFLNFFTRFIFADINRNLTQMLGVETPLKIINYQSLQNKLSGFFAKKIGDSYRVVTLVRHEDYPEIVAHKAILNQKNKTD